MQLQVDELKKENMQMKQQLHAANEKRAQLEKTYLEITKNNMLNELHQQQQQQQQQQKGDYDTTMEDTEEFPPLTNNNNNKGSSDSKYAHVYNTTNPDYSRNTNLKDKPENNKGKKNQKTKLLNKKKYQHHRCYQSFYCS